MKIHLPDTAAPGMRGGGNPPWSTEPPPISCSISLWASSSVPAWPVCDTSVGLLMWPIYKHDLHFLVFSTISH